MFDCPWWDRVRLCKNVGACLGVLVCDWMFACVRVRNLIDWLCALVIVCVVCDA